MKLELKIEADPYLARYWTVIDDLGNQARPALARAVNRTVDAVHTRTVRALAHQTSAPRKLIVAAVKKHKAAHQGFTAIVGSVEATGREIPLSAFHAHQFAFGVRAKVWGRLQQFPHAFGAQGDSPALVARLGGRVFVRRGRDRLPIHQLYGPSIPKEIVKGETAEAFKDTVAEVLPKRIEHEVFRVLAGNMLRSGGS